MRVDLREWAEGSLVKPVVELDTGSCLGFKLECLYPVTRLAPNAKTSAYTGDLRSVGVKVNGA
jgi:hypothetical protein